MSNASNILKEDMPDEILLAEQDPAVRRSIQLLLRGNGHDVKAYGQALALVNDRARHPLGCLVIDQAMASLDGTSVPHVLNAQGWTGRAILLAMDPAPALLAGAQARGFDVVLPKPVQAHLLAEAIARIHRRQMA